MDVLSDVLRCVRLTGAVFFDMKAHAPWVGTTPKSSVISSLVMPEAERVICFHILVAGDAWAALEDGSVSPMRLSAGDVVIAAKGDSHFLSSGPGMRGEPDLGFYRRPAGHPLPLPHVLNETAGGPESCHFVCGYLGCDLRPFNPLIESLPRLFAAHASPASQAWLSSLLRTAVNETDDDGAGREIMLAKLAELIFVDVLRKYVSELEEHSRGWFSGLRDRHVGGALGLMHGRPEKNWTLDSLSREVGLSRSAFAERFNAYVGSPPIEYLVRWRMQLAAKLLDEGVDVTEAAAQVGYTSPATFNRVFKRFAGTTPGAWRRAKRNKTTVSPYETATAPYGQFESGDRLEMVSELAQDRRGSS
jgi:AraC-like DNA-binding protein